MEIKKEPISYCDRIFHFLFSFFFSFSSFFYFFELHFLFIVLSIYLNEICLRNKIESSFGIDAFKPLLFYRKKKKN